MTLGRLQKPSEGSIGQGVSDPVPAGSDPRVYGVATGDLVLLLAFAFIGRWSHHELNTGGLWGTLGTAVPFLLGWAVCAPLLGAYAPVAFRTYRSALVRALVAWPAALVVGLVIRSVVQHEIPAFTFMLVALLFNLLTLSIWRTLVVALRLYQSSDEHKL